MTVDEEADEGEHHSSFGKFFRLTKFRAWNPGKKIKDCLGTGPTLAFNTVMRRLEDLGLLSLPNETCALICRGGGGVMMTSMHPCEIEREEDDGLVLLTS